MKIRPKKIWTMKLTADCPTATRSEVGARGLSLVIDEPVERGGTNTGLMPVEVVMAGLAGCTNVITHKIARANDIEIINMAVEVTTTMDSIGTALVTEIDVPFPKVIIDIRLRTAASDEKIDILKRDLPRFCAVSKMLQQSGSQVKENWIVERP
jgi:putative redox protein